MGDAMKFVFCEGKDDVAVMRGLASHLKLDIQVEEYGGKSNLANFLRTLPKRPEFTQQQVSSMAVLRDADSNAAATFTSVRDTLIQNNFEAPDVDGTFTEAAMRVGVFIIGVNGTGMIEDLCLKSVSDQPEYSCVDSYFDCIAQKSARSNFSSKGKVRVWMASHEDFEYYIGKAADKGYWPWDNFAFDALKNFLKTL
jgi:hypothetical protein